MTRKRISSHVSSIEDGSAPYSMLNSTADSMEDGIEVINEENVSTTVNIIRLNRSNLRAADSSTSDDSGDGLPPC